MEEEVEELRAQVKKLQEMLEQETLLKVDFKNQNQSLKEDMLFRKKIYEEVSTLGIKELSRPKNSHKYSSITVHNYYM